MAQSLRSLRQVATLRHGHMARRFAPALRTLGVCVHSWLHYRNFLVRNLRLGVMFALGVMSLGVMSGHQYFLLGCETPCCFRYSFWEFHKCNVSILFFEVSFLSFRDFLTCSQQKLHPYTFLFENPVFTWNQVMVIENVLYSGRLLRNVSSFINKSMKIWLNWKCRIATKYRKREQKMQKLFIQFLTVLCNFDQNQEWTSRKLNDKSIIYLANLCLGKGKWFCFEEKEWN